MLLQTCNGIAEQCFLFGCESDTLFEKVCHLRNTEQLYCKYARKGFYLAIGVNGSEAFMYFVCNGFHTVGLLVSGFVAFAFYKVRKSY